MHISRLALLAAAAAALIPASSAQSESPAPVNTKYFFQCADAVKVRNNRGAAPWSLTAPTGSYMAGEGCGYLDTSFRGTAPGNDVFDAVFAGDHFGPVDDFTVRLHDLLLSQPESALPGSVSFTVVLEVDGKVVFDSTTRDPAYEYIGSLPFTGGNGLTNEVMFSLVDLGITSVRRHSYRLTIGKYYVDTAGAWVFGAKEMPAGVEFNPVLPLGTRIRVGGPA